MQDLTKPSLNGDISINPFGDDVYSPHSIIPGTPQIHQEEMTHCVQAIEKMVAMTGRTTIKQSHGEMISISSPLAGYGKSHLISRISKSVLNSVSSLDLSFGPQVSWDQLLNMTLQNLDSTSSRVRITNSLLDETAAYFLSNLIGTAVAQGVIEERDCPAALATLQSDYCSAFSEGSRSKLLVWFKKKSSLIRSSAKLSSTGFAGFSSEDGAFWSDYFFNHFKKDEAGQKTIQDLSEMEARERLLQLLKIASLCHPLLIIADHLDSCHGSQTAGMEIASALTSIVENVSNCVLIISYNNDLWESVFKDKLPSALMDRMSSENLELSSIDIDEAKELIVNRLCSSGVSYHQSHLFANEVSENSKWADAEKLFPRGVLREAKDIWKTRGHEFHQPLPQETSQEFPTQTKPENIEFEQPASVVNTDVHLSEPKASPDLSFPNQLTSPFEGPAMIYPDRPVPQAPVPQPYDNNSPGNPYSDTPQPETFPQESSNNLQAERVGAEPLPYQPPYPQQNPRHNDEPAPRPPAGDSPINVKTANGKPNGNYVNGSQNGVKVPIQPTQTQTPVEAYYNQLVKHFGKMKDKLELDLPALELFIKTVGENHSPLTQDEIFVPGGQSSCLRWDLSNYLVWIGFEPARNIYYYNNVLQKLLSDPPATPGKIVCFSHTSNPFNHDLLTTNGITSEFLKRYFDFIQLSNDELVLVHSAARFLKETSEKGFQDEALKFVLKELNPLWLRLCQPIGS